MTERRMRLITDFLGTGQVIKADKLLSQQNQQLFRQGYVYDLKLDLDPGHVGPVDIWALSPTWILKNAWMQAKQVYEENIKEEVSLLQKSQMARWRDFRVEDCLPGYGEAKIVTYESPGAASFAIHDPITAGRAEYATATVVTEAGANWNFGLDSMPSCFDIFSEYLDNYHVSASPTDSTDDQLPYGILSDEIQQSSMEHLKENGNLPPYDDMSAVGSTYDRKWIYIGRLESTSNGDQRLSTGYFAAPLGIIATQGWNAVSFADKSLTLTAKAGKYKGVSAIRMEDC